MIARRAVLKGAAAAFAASALDLPEAMAGADDDLCYVSVDALLTLFKAGKTSPVDVLKAQIKRVEAFNPKVNAITYEHFDQALKEARLSEERYRRGEARPLEGITVAIKDEDGRAGWRTTMGSLIFKDAPPAAENSALIDALEAAGAVMPFQTTVPEFYLFANASTRAWGTTRNPWNLQYSPGGSSAGSAAALAAGFSTLATGSDMGGSIRIPASQCGLYGFKSPFGRVATSEIPYETEGPLARRFDDLVHMQNAIDGPSEKIMSALRPKLDYPYQYPEIAGWRIALDWGTGIGELIPSVKEAMLQAAATLRAGGCVVDEVDCGFSKNQMLVFMRGLMSSAEGTLALIAASRRDLLSPHVAEMIDSLGGAVGPAQAAEADALAETLHRQVQQRVFGKGYRVLLMPTVSSPLIGADLLGATQPDLGKATGMNLVMTWPWNLLNRYPVMDVPLGVVEDHMPAGMQAIGQTYADVDVFQFAANWSKLRPPLFTDERFPAFRGSP